MLPAHYKQCFIHFPTDQPLVLAAAQSATSTTTRSLLSSATTGAWTQPPTATMTSPPAGLLVEMTRLNIPCNSATSISFSGSDNARKLCGKLEEYLLDERTFYFREHNDTSVQLSGSPVFRFTYKLVDYCYNITISDRNNSIFLQPIQTNLDCNFRIHLPYGNRISLSLIINLNSDSGSAAAMAHTNDNTTSNTPRGGSVGNKVMPQERIELGAVSSSQSNACSNGSLRVELLSVTSSNWITCVSASNPPKLYLYTSSDNFLAIHITKVSATSIDNDATSGLSDSLRSAPQREPQREPQQQQYQPQHNSIAQELIPSVYFEYNAIPVETITSPKCAFGWIALNQQSCITVVDDVPVTWHVAAEECERRGAKLAAMRNEREQSVVDQLILNR